MIEKPILHFLTGPTAVGKTRIQKATLRDFPLDFGKFVTSTTRDRRLGDKPGETREKFGYDYHFRKLHVFKDFMHRRRLFEFEEVYENSFYGCEKASLEKVIQSGKRAIGAVDVNGALKFIGKRPSTEKSFVDLTFAQPVVFFITAPKDQLVARIKKDYEDGLREGGIKKMNERIEKMDYELSQSVHFENVIDNSNGKFISATNEVVNRILHPGNF